TPPTAPTPIYTSAETTAKAQACYGEAPKIESMMPDEGKAGDKVTISGRNFGPAECLRSLSFGPGYPATFKFDSETQITATVPNGRHAGLAMMTVTTASGEDSKVFVVK
nr:IPT/TIG domain-containing protein [Nitrospira sp.]